MQGSLGHTIRHTFPHLFIRDVRLPRPRDGHAPLEHGPARFEIELRNPSAAGEERGNMLRNLGIVQHNPVDMSPLPVQHPCTAPTPLPYAQPRLLDNTGVLPSHAQIQLALHAAVALGGGGGAGEE